MAVYLIQSVADNNPPSLFSQSSDVGSYEATATYSDGKYTKTETMTLTNSGANVVSRTQRNLENLLDT